MVSDTARARAGDGLVDLIYSFDDGSWQVVCHRATENKRPWRGRGRTLPEAFRALADDLEKDE